jgi:eukaryotic-like serine/threonine-protein kinase
MRPAEVEMRLRRVAEPPAVSAAVPVRPPRRARLWVARPVAAAALACAIVGVLAILTGGTGRLLWAGADAQAARVPSVQTATFMLPSGFHWWNDSSGFQVAVPDGWSDRAEAGGAVAFYAPGGQPSLRISAWTPGRDGVLAALVARERLAALPAYRRIRIETLQLSSDAVWEYTFRDSKGTTMRGLERVKASGGRTYLLEWRTPRSTWTTHVQKLSVVLDSFHAGSG